MRRSGAVFLSVLVLAGCAASDERPSVLEADRERPVACGPELEGDAAMHLELVEEMAEQGSDRAVLAHLDALESFQVEVPAEVTLLRAHAHRRLGELESARNLYRELRDGCMPGEGHRGLGLVAAQEGELDRAIDRFKRALEHRPVDARLRNDLGYAYLLSEDYEQARKHLETARELGGGERAISNLVLLSMHEGDYEQARRLAKEAGMETEEWESLGREVYRQDSDS